MSPRKLDLAITLGIVLEVLEILRRLPGWLLVSLAAVASMVVYVVYVHPWWTAAVLVAIVGMRRTVGRQRVRSPAP